MKKALTFVIIIYFIIISIIANSYTMLANEPKILFLFVPLFLFINIFAGVFFLKTKSKRLKICCHGNVLLSAFMLSLPVSVVYHIVLAFKTIPDNYLTFIWSALLCICLEAIVFWNGIICVYLTSVQLGINQRIIGIICGMIPIANLIALYVILKATFKEVITETQKQKINLQRKSQNICKTKYPILMVHGVFFRDTKYFNYWGRIPKELEQNGAEIYYGNHQSASSIADSAEELSERIKTLVKELNCEKINIIAHSKGGLDCRYAISNLDAAPHVASLTTINTPHRGCEFADYLLTKISVGLKNKVASTYNAALRKFGDKNPDFLAAVNDLTAGVCTKLDSEMKTPPEIFCQSVGSVLAKAQGGKFPLNFSYHLVKHFDGPNDGLVSSKSFKWGEKYTLLTPSKKRGISHGDMIDLNRENIDGFDIREFYVELVKDLKDRGL
ncbi:MAG: alpha/beta hydrolase [Clostridia bacterium]|nr:alpha/beta hydrolase [Clostridia bacterium]